MTDSYTLKVIITALDKTKGVFSKLGGTMAKLGKTLLKGFAIGGVAAAAGIAALTAGVGKLIAIGAKVGPIQDAFKKMAGVSYKKVLDEFDEMGRGMISHTDAMMAYNSAIGLISKDFADKLPKAMNLLGKVSAATGEDIGYLMNSLVTGVGRLSPMILDNLKIQVKLTDAYDEYAKEIGKSVGELTKQEQQMAINAMTMAKLEEKYGDLAVAEDPFKKFSTSLANIKDDFAVSISGTLLPGINALMDMFAKFSKSDKFAAIMDRISGSIVAVGEKVTKFLLIFAEKGWNSGEMASFIDNIFGAGTRNKISDFIKTVKGVIEWVGDALGAAIGFSSNIMTGLWIPVFEAVSSFIIANVVPVIKVLIAWLSENIPKAVKQLTVVWETVLQPVFSAFVKFLTEGVFPYLAMLFDIISGQLPGGAGILSKIWKGVLLPAMQKLSTFLSTVLFPALTKLAQWLTIEIPKAVARLKQIWEQDFYGIRTIFESVINIIKAYFDVFRAAFTGDWEALGEALRRLWDSAWTLIITATTSAGRLLGAAITALIKAIIKKLLTTDWSSVGKGIVMGVVDGINNFAIWAVNAAKNLGTAIWEVLKGIFKASSPSKLMMELGENISKGLAIGIENITPKVAVSAGNLGRTVVHGLGTASISRASLSGRALSSVPNVTVEISPIITTADQVALETVLGPVIRKIIRESQ